MKRNKIYLAIPFNTMEDLSFEVANKVAAELIYKGNLVFSPISHSYPIWKATKNTTTDHEVWMDQDKAFVNWCDEVHVVVINRDWGLDKIKNSKGVQQEIKWAQEQNKLVKYIPYDNL